jgi:hypothetical protein
MLAASGRWSLTEFPLVIEHIGDHIIALLAGI